MTGAWTGTLDTGSSKLRIVIRLSGGGAGPLGGTLDSPDQGVTGIPLSSVLLQGQKLRIELKSIGGVFEGTIGADGQQITGTWARNSVSRPLVLHPAGAPR